MSEKTTFVVKEDPTNPEERIIEFPEGFLESMGWLEGDDLVWEIRDKQVLLINKSKDERDKKTP